MARRKLVFEDYRPIRANEPGYSPTKRLYISERSGGVIPVSRFQKGAQGKLVPTLSMIREPGAPRPASQLTTNTYKTPYQLALSNYQNKYGLTYNQARQSADFKVLYKTYSKFTHMNEKQRQKVDKSPKGNLAQTLVRLGLRDPNATYDVGDTPKVG